MWLLRCAGGLFILFLLGLFLLLSVLDLCICQYFGLQPLPKSFQLKGIVHPKILFQNVVHPHVIPNLYEFLSYAEHKRRYFEECWQSISDVSLLLP